eukprot:UN06246
MRVNRMNLEEALDDGLSIVPSIGKYANSELSGIVTTTTENEPVPGSVISRSTLSTTYKPDVDKYLSAPYHEQGSGNSGSSTTIDEEKSEIFENDPVHIMRYNLKNNH